MNDDIHHAPLEALRHAISTLNALNDSLEGRTKDLEHALRPFESLAREQADRALSRRIDFLADQLSNETSSLHAAFASQISDLEHRIKALEPPPGFVSKDALDRALRAQSRRIDYIASLLSALKRHHPVDYQSLSARLNARIYALEQRLPT